MRIQLLLAFCLWQTVIHAQTTLRVRVVDPSGMAIVNAAGSLIPRDGRPAIVFRSDASGAKEIREIAAGEYIIQVSAGGFEPSTQRIELADGQPREVELQLGLPSLATRIQVTAAATPQTVDEQAKAVDVVDVAQIEQRGEYFVAEAIRNVPGIRVQQLGGPGSFTRILTRGLRTMDTSILIDGFRFRDIGSPQGDASAFVGDLLVGDTARVEVLRGSGSSLYGTHAVGGVVNIITQSGGGPFHGEVSADGGGLGVARGVFRFGGGAFDEKLSYSAALTHLNVTRGVDGDDRARNSVAHGSATWRAAQNTSISTRLLASNSFAQLNDSPFSLPNLPSSSVIEARPGATFSPALNDPDSRRAADYFSGLLSVTQTVKPSLILRAFYQAVATDRDSRDGPAGQRFEPLFANSSAYNGRIDTAQAKADWSLSPSHVITAGYEFERSRFENISRDENPNLANRTDATIDVTEQSHAVFAQDQIRLLGSRLNISLSGRGQWFDLSPLNLSRASSPYSAANIGSAPEALTGDAAVAYYWQGSGTKVRGHVGNSYRAPALYERFGASFFSGSFSFYGDPRLAPERALSFDGGVDQFLANASVRLSATYFYTKLQEVIGFDFSGLITPGTDPYGRFIGYRNTGGGLARGAEFSAEARLPWSGTVNAAYTFTNSDERVSVFTTGNLRSIRISDHTFSATLTQRVGRRFDASFDFFAASDYLYSFGTRAFQFEGPVKADVAFGYNIPISDGKNLRLYGRVDNVLNRSYYEEGFRAPRAWGIFGMKLLF